MWIPYAYSAGDDKWGQWFLRAVRLPAQQLKVQLALSAHWTPS
ncbi:hypothetical protein [Streptomyces sp. NPDC055189]